MDIGEIMKKEQSRLGSDKVGKLLLEFSIPATTGMMVGALYNIVDRMFVGNAKNLSTYGLGALTICFPIMMIMMGLALLFGAGGATLFSIKLGAKDKKGAGVILGNVIVMVFITQIIFMVVTLWKLEPILLLFGADEAFMPYAIEYMRIILYAAIFQGPAMACNHLMRADGSPRSAMISQLIGAGFNILFDYILIYSIGMGMTGAALATIGGQALSAIWGVSYFLTKRSNIKLRISNMRLKPNIILKIIMAGLPSFFNQITGSILNIILNNKLGQYGGNVAISVMGAITSIQHLMIMPIVGISHGSQPIIGYNKGSNQFNRIKETLKKAILAATTIVIIGFILTRLFPDKLIQMFGSDLEFIEFGTWATEVWFFMLPVIGFQIVGSLYFQAVGKPRVGLFLTMTRQLIFLIPLIIILSSTMGLEGILFAAPLADGAAFLITLLFLIFEVKRLNKMSQLFDMSEQLNYNPKRM
jgi:putative MATE family efflux protein